VIVRRKDMKKEDSKDNEGLFGPEIAPHFKKNLCYLRSLLFDLLLLRRALVFLPRKREPTSSRRRYRKIRRTGNGRDLLINNIDR
jgi:hypothetical protein